MGDPPKPDAKPKPGWVAPFASRLCVIGWTTMILTEILPRSGIEFLCILFGSHASAIAILTCLVVWLRYQKGIFLLLVLAAAPPTAYFAIVLQQVARNRGW